MSSIFSKIIAGEIPCYKVAEDSLHIAFLDINPLKKGHCLVVPKKEVDYIFDLANDDFVALHLFSKKVAKAIEKTISCERIGVTVIGLEVPHAHIHLVPISEVDDMNFKIKRKSQTISNASMQELANEILENFNLLQQIISSNSHL